MDGLHASHFFTDEAAEKAVTTTPHKISQGRGQTQMNATLILRTVYNGKCWELVLIEISFFSPLYYSAELDKAY